MASINNDPIHQKMQSAFVFANSLSNFFRNLHIDIKHIVESSGVEIPFSSKVFTDIIKSIQFSGENLKEIFELFVQEKYRKAIEESENLREVNAKILKKIPKKQDTPKVEEKACQYEKVKIVKLETASQTDEIFVKDQEKDLCCEHSLLDSSQISSVLDNSIVNSSQTSTSKLSKIIIYHIPDNINDQKIVNAISDFNSDKTSSVKVLKTFKVRNQQKLNYIIEVTSDIAKCLIRSGRIQIGNLFFSVKRFVKVYRCFNCQSFNHLAKDCKKIRICVWCGEHHELGHCTKPVKCRNCVLNNVRNHDFNVNHPAFSHKCESLRYFIMKVRLRLNAKFA